MLTKAQLLADGCVPNPNVYISDGFFYCPGCKRYTFHSALSHRGLSDCYEICGICEQYYGLDPLKGVAVPVASDILENAKELTVRYAEAVEREALAHAAKAPIELAVVPSRVFVLLQSGTVLGVLTTEQKALDEAYSLMHSTGRTWEEMLPNRMWRSTDDGVCVYIEVSAHDVR